MTTKEIDGRRKCIQGAWGNGVWPWKMMRAQNSEFWLLASRDRAQGSSSSDARLADLAASSFKCAADWSIGHSKWKSNCRMPCCSIRKTLSEIQPDVCQRASIPSSEHHQYVLSNHPRSRTEREINGFVDSCAVVDLVRRQIWCSRSWPSLPGPIFA